MIYKEEKRRFFQALINSQIQPDDFYVTARKLAVAVPDGVLSKWKKKFYSAGILRALPENPRLVNKFTIGADPEYVLTDNASNYQYANQLYLTTLEACGCDLSGRQMELRASPSRFVLDIVASILETLRWQVVKYPATLYFNWRAIGLMGNDGCGGHVHFARKNKDRASNVKSLDAMSSYMINYDFLPGAKDRSTASRYGRAGDVRNTSYGYEYRTLSTWLNSPFSAYIAMVAAKLAMYHDWSAVRMLRVGPMALENLLAAYQYEDDDAAIALQAMRVRKTKRSFQDVYALQDMRYSWGFLRVGSKIAMPPNGLVDMQPNPKIFLPPIITPSQTVREELFQHLVTDSPLGTKHGAQKTWEPYELKKDESVFVVSPHEAGLSEVAQGLISKGISIYLCAADTPTRVSVSAPSNMRGFFNLMRSKLAKEDISMIFTEANRLDFAIYIPRNPGVRGDRYIVPATYVAKWRRILLNSGLPIVDYRDYKSLAPVVEPKPRIKSSGKLIFESA